MRNKISSALITFVILSTTEFIQSCLNATIQWKITVKQKDNELNKVELSLGGYSAIEIIFSKIAEEPVTDINGVLKLSLKDEFMAPEGDSGILFDTSKSTSIQAHIGRSCLKQTVEGQSFTITFEPDSTGKDLIESSQITITVHIPQPYELQVEQTNNRLSFEESSTYSITPASDVLMNVDEIKISFDGEKTNSIDSYIESFSIAKFPSKGDQSKPFGIKTKFDYIVHSQKFTPSIDPLLQKCFKISKVFEFSMKDDAIDLITQQVKTDLISNAVITDEKKDYSLDISIKSFKISSVEINCAMYCREIGEVTDEDIIANDRGKHSADELSFEHKTHETKESIDLLFTFTSMSRLCLHRLKCIVTPFKIEDPQNFQKESLTIGSFQSADIHREIKLSIVKFSSINCALWKFSKPFNKGAFESKAIEYFKNNIPLSDEEKEKSCLSFELNKYMSPSDTFTSICLIPNKFCAFINSYHYHDSFRVLLNTISTTEGIRSKLEITDDNLVLSHSRHESDYHLYNYKDISASIIGMTPYYFTIKLSTKGNPAVCFFKEINEVEEYDFFEEDFYDTTTQVDLSSEQKYINVQTNKHLADNKLITIYINCLNFPDHAHYHHYAPYKLLFFYNTENPMPGPKKEKLEACTELDSFKPHCKGHIVVDYPSYGKNPIQRFSSYTQFTSLDLHSKIEYVNNQKIDEATLSKDNLISLSLLSHQLSLINCIEYNSFSECRKVKNDQITKIINKIRKYTSVVLSKENEYFKLEYANTLFFISQNKDAFGADNGKTFIDIVMEYIKNIQVIVTLFKRETSISFVSVCNGILTNMIDILQYEEIDKGIKSKVDENTRLIVNDYSLKVIKAIESILPLAKDYFLPDQYPNFHYSFLNVNEKTESSDQMKELPLNDKDSSKIEIPLYYFNEKQIDYLMVVVYSTFPLLSFQNTQTNKKVISIKAFDKKNKLIEVKNLQKPVNIYYGNIKADGKMKHCGYYDNDKKTILNEGIKTHINNDKQPICQTTHFSDFIITKYDFSNKENPKESFPIWAIILSSIIGAVLISTITYFIYVKYKKYKIEDDVNKTSPLLNSETD